MRLFPKGYPRHLPDWLNLLRLALGAIFVLLVVLQAPIHFQLSVFIAAAVTDWLDGPLARKLGVADDDGAFMDGLADKLALNAALISLVYVDALPLYCVFILVGRDSIVFLARYLAAQQGVSTSRLGGQINMWLVFAYIVHGIIQHVGAELNWIDVVVVLSAVMSGSFTVIAVLRRCQK